MAAWVREDAEPAAARRRSTELERASSGPSPPARRAGRNENAVPADIAAEMRRAAASATAYHREVLVGRMQDAVFAYERSRYPEAARLAGALARETPEVAAVRELAGLANYRMGRWREAARQLEAYGALTDDSEHLPVLMDCYRALRRPAKVASLWTELRQRSPEPDLLAEARMVVAGSLADRGDLPGAISLLATAGAGRMVRNPSDRHVRQWYALADLYERAGDLPRAREYFDRVATVDPEAYDVTARLESLGHESGDKPRAKRRVAKPKPRSVKKDAP